MKNYIVYFEYYSAGESGNDKYRFTSHDEALAKMDEFKRAIKMNFSDCADAEIIDEPDFYGIMDHTTSDFAKVILQEVFSRS
ncbi:MAG: hypothetical protein Q4B68_07905 [Bacteroidales bacterium]|nr:hypothetical protein [Bacteroidales bacterium]